MNIEHIAMYVNDLEYARDFLLPILAEKQMMATITGQLVSGLISSASIKARDWRS